MNFNIRTDLALENREIYNEANQKEAEIPGIKAFVDNLDDELCITTVKILSKAGSEALSKPIGEYVTIESPYMNDEVEEIDNKIIDILAKNIQKLAKLNRDDTVLVVGLRQF